MLGFASLYSFLFNLHGSKAKLYQKLYSKGYASLLDLWPHPHLHTVANSVHEFRGFSSHALFLGFLPMLCFDETITHTPHPTLAFSPWQWQYIQEITDIRSRADSSSPFFFFQHFLIILSVVVPYFIQSLSHGLSFKFRWFFTNNAAVNSHVHIFHIHGVIYLQINS